MTIEKTINQGKITLMMDDLTLLDVEAFVFYARSDLKLGSGFGNAIAVRGGPTIKKELDQMEPLEVGKVAITSAGNLQAEWILHANGPKFQEPDLKDKLYLTIMNSLALAEAKDIKRIGFPPMGTGFYGIPLPLCADIMVGAFKEYLEKHSSIEEIIICVMDNREYFPFKDKLEKL
jgi:O-acetyl-ADP-ribose deacetylase (regulator of RNase III)